MVIKLKDLIVEKNEKELKQVEELNNWLKKQKRISLKQVVDELNKIKGVKAEVADMTYDTRGGRGGMRTVDRSKAKGIKINYKGKPIFNFHTKSFDPVGNWSLADNAIEYLRDEIK